MESGRDRAAADDAVAVAKAGKAAADADAVAAAEAGKIAADTSGDAVAAADKMLKDAEAIQDLEGPCSEGQAAQVEHVHRTLEALYVRARRKKCNISHPSLGDDESDDGLVSSWDQMVNWAENDTRMMRQIMARVLKAEVRLCFFEMAEDH